MVEYNTRYETKICFTNNWTNYLNPSREKGRLCVHLCRKWQVWLEITKKFSALSCAVCSSKNSWSVPQLQVENLLILPPERLPIRSLASYKFLEAFCHTHDWILVGDLFSWKRPIYIRWVPSFKSRGSHLNS